MTTTFFNGILCVICEACQERVQVLSLHLPRRTCPICQAQL
jgi:hypothetical protein